MVQLPHLTAAMKQQPATVPPLLTRSEFNEQHVNEVGSCLLRRVIDGLVAEETPTFS
jgi:hypothetical protein